LEIETRIWDAEPFTKIEGKQQEVARELRNKITITGRTLH